MEGDTTQIPEQKFEYLDHTADVQLHAWGSDLKEAFEQVAMAMFAYMTTNYDSVDMTSSYEIDATGSDMKSLLFHFLDEWLFAFSAGDFFFPRIIKITEFDRQNFRIKATGFVLTSLLIAVHLVGVNLLTYLNILRARK
uniref:Archease domain-containing protein n=1 Tax=Mesocestoides corti TaxID=53468 RepID=A0A5K3FMN3_MESCO